MGGTPSSKLVILYATQTGNALDAAERIAREAERRALPVLLRSLDEIDPVNLFHMSSFSQDSFPEESFTVFVVSTTGQGDTPDSMKACWRFLLKKTLSKDWLQRLNYAVFGLGDSGYQKYNFVAKKLDRRLSDLGAKQIIERGLGDDQHPSGYDGALDPWVLSFWQNLFSLKPELFPNGPNFTLSDKILYAHPKVRVTYHQNERESTSCSGLEHLIENVTRSRSMSCSRFIRDQNTPHCFLKLVKNQLLTKPGFEKDVRHLEFEFDSPAVEYKVGDVLELLPRQTPQAVDSFINRCNLDPKALITVHQEGDKSLPKAPINLKSFIETCMDISSASPRRFFFEVMSHFAKAEHEKERLKYFVSPEGRDDLYQYNQKERRTALEALQDFPSVDLPLEWLIQVVPPLKARPFSISSSPTKHPHQVHLTVAVVSWKTPFKRTRNGLCSSWLAGLLPQQDLCIPAWVRKGLLPPPSPSTPIILVGPGTGCAPFRAFLEERIEKDKKIGAAPVMFFFGCRNEKNDYLYRELWEANAGEKGLLSEERGGGFFVAFSRDQVEKVYVQHKIRENSGRVWDLMVKGASIYVAGSANNMPADVMAAFEDVVCRESGLLRDAAVALIRKLQNDSKFNVEAWS